MQKLLESLKNNSLKWGTGAMLLAIPLYPKFPLLRVPGTYVSVRLEDFLILTVSIVWLISEIKNIKILLKNKIVQAILIFLTVALLSVISGIFLTKTVQLHIGILHWVRRIEYFMAFFIGLSALKSKKSLNFYVKCLIIAVFIMFFYGLGQKYLYWPIVTTQNLEYSKGVALRYTPGAHINSTFAGHYDLASYLVLVLPLFFTVLFTVKDKVSKIIIFLVIASGFWLLVNAISRISMISYLTGVSIALALIRKYKTIPIFIILSILISFLSPDLTGRYGRILEVSLKAIMKLNYIVSPTYAQEITVEMEPVFEDRSTSIRFNVEWPRAMRAFSKNPFLGTGFSSITLATDNEYLRLLGELGILGFVAFFLIFLRLETIFLKELPFSKTTSLETAYEASLIAALPAIFVSLVFIDVFEASKFAITFWLLIGIAVSLIKNKNYEKNI